MNRLLKLLIIDCIAGRTRSSKLVAEEARVKLLFRQLMLEFMENHSIAAIAIVDANVNANIDANVNANIDANVNANIDANVDASEEIMDTEFIGLGGAFDDEGEINVMN